MYFFRKYMWKLAVRSSMLVNSKFRVLSHYLWEHVMVGNNVKSRRKAVLWWKKLLRSAEKISREMNRVCFYLAWVHCVCCLSRLIALRPFSPDNVRHLLSRRAIYKQCHLVPHSDAYDFRLPFVIRVVFSVFPVQCFALLIYIVSEKEKVTSGKFTIALKSKGNNFLNHVDKKCFV